ncbi:MAG: IS200/IS605 family transposase, partial [Vulcanimicrobiaceae bacterium]
MAHGEHKSDLRTGRHCVSVLHVHLVFVTKYRRHVFSKAILDAMRPIFENVCRDFEASLVEFDGEDDHVHLLVNSLKGVSS